MRAELPSTGAQSTALGTAAAPQLPGHIPALWLPALPKPGAPALLILPAPSAPQHRGGRLSHLQQVLWVPWHTEELCPALCAPADPCPAPLCPLGTASTAGPAHTALLSPGNKFYSKQTEFALDSTDKLLLWFFFLIFLSVF